jgi:hypothetical protein
MLEPSKSGAQGNPDDRYPYGPRDLPVFDGAS